MRINGVLYTFRKVAAGGHEIYADGVWCGWSAGNITDAKNTAREIARETTRSASV